MSLIIIILWFWKKINKFWAAKHVLSGQKCDFCKFFLKILKFHMFSHINHCFHDVQHHLIIIIDGLKSRKSHIFACQIKHVDFLVWTQGSISDLVWSRGRGCDYVISMFWSFGVRWQRRKLKDEAETGVSAERLQNWVFARVNRLWEFFMKFWLLLL